MIYDMRTYDIAMGKTQEYMAAVREIALPVRESYGIKLAGWYYTDVGTLNRVVHIWAYRDYAHFDEAREAFRTDERWVNDYVPRVKGMILRQENQLMRASDFFEAMLMEAEPEDCDSADSEDCDSAGPESEDSDSMDNDGGDAETASADTDDPAQDEEPPASS